MDLHTVNVRVKGLFQNGEPFCGKLRLKLSTSAVCVDNTIVLPKAWQEHNFPTSGDLTVQLVPNALLCEGSHYVFELVCNKNTGAYIYDRYGKLTTVERGVIVVPDRDCNFTEIVTLEPTQPEPLEAAKAYASEAKETLRETKEVAAGVQGAADKEIERIERESVTIRDNALKAITEEGERVKGIVDDNIETSTDAAKRAEDARDTVVEYVDVTFPAKVSRVDANLNNKVTEIDTYLDRKANGIYTAIDAEMVAADAHLEDAQKQIISNIEGKATSVNAALDTKLATANTEIDGKVGVATQAVTDATQAKTNAETAKKGAEEARDKAQQSATTASNKAQEAKAYAESGSDALNARILRENVGISVAEYRVEVGDSPSIIALVSAPKGAIAVANAHKNIFWLHDGTFTQTQLLRSTLEMDGNFLLKWWEGNAVYAVYKGTDGATKKATITFVNDEPKTLDVQTLSDIDVTTITEARYCYAEGNVVVTSAGQVFNKDTIAFIGSFTAPLYERMSPKDTDGYFKFITKGTSSYRMSRVAIQEDETPSFSTYGDCATLSEPEPLMVGMMNTMGMAFDSGTANGTSPWSTKTYARGLYLFNNSAGRATPSVVAECLAEIYIPKNLYIGGASLTYIPAQHSLPFIRQVWRSSLSEIGAENSQWQARQITGTFITTRSGDGRYYFVYPRRNVRPGLFVQEFTEV